MMFASLCPIDKGGKWLFKGKSKKKLKKITLTKQKRAIWLAFTFRQFKD
ncbi:hypothetical protein VISI1226_15021 [Vibrio sinaloensis DSM 21326]|uniref:Uncharacterized protein n=1 Tax=Vibrio sinaloensis DSM 21326 TaxID=945550 RepID=E8MCN7_PHOS4|nr:hypothetical protein VISI1226_15021 [Vibrio sinaloensis DSM 21326]